MLVEMNDSYISSHNTDDSISELEPLSEGIINESADSSSSNESTEYNQKGMGKYLDSDRPEAAERKSKSNF